MISAVRTTLDIEDDVLQAAKELAANRKRTLGAVVSELLRAALEPAAAGETRNGMRLLPKRATGPKPTLELVNKLRDDE
jgi:hypothetical protein